MLINDNKSPVDCTELTVGTLAKHEGGGKELREYLQSALQRLLPHLKHVARLRVVGANTSESSNMSFTFGIIAMILMEGNFDRIWTCSESVCALP